MHAVRAVSLLAVLGLAGCLSVLDPPHSTGVHRDPAGPCSAASCPGGYWCADFETCATSCRNDEDCRPGWLCCHEGEVADSDSPDGCPWVNECFEN